MIKFTTEELMFLENLIGRDISNITQHINFVLYENKDSKFNNTLLDIRDSRIKQLRDLKIKLDKMFLEQHSTLDNDVKVL